MGFYCSSVPYLDMACGEKKGQSKSLCWPQKKKINVGKAIFRFQGGREGHILLLFILMNFLTI